MDRQSRKIKSVIDSSARYSTSNKEQILSRAKQEMYGREGGSARKNRSYGKIWGACGVAVAAVLIAVIGINLFGWFGSGGTDTPNVDNNFSTEVPQEVVFAFTSAYEYAVDVVSDSELKELNIEYLRLAEAENLYHKIYYYKDTDAIAMIESYYARKNSAGNTVQITLSTVFSTDTFHEKYSDLLEVEDSTYETYSIKFTSGYENGEYLSDMIYISECSYILTVQSPDNFDVEDYFKLLYESLGQ